MAPSAHSFLQSATLNFIIRNLQFEIVGRSLVSRSLKSKLIIKKKWLTLNNDGQPETSPTKVTGRWMRSRQSLTNSSFLSNYSGLHSAGHESPKSCFFTHPSRMWRGKYCARSGPKFSLAANRNPYPYTNAYSKRHTNAYADNGHSTNWHIGLD